jgi:alpha-L-fucosidase
MRLTTRNGDRLYLHLFGWPFKHVHLEGLAGRVEYVQLLNDASEIRMQVIDPDQQAQNTTMGGIPRGTLTLQLPPVEVPVVELFLKA